MVGSPQPSGGIGGLRRLRQQISSCPSRWRFSTSYDVLKTLCFSYCGATIFWWWETKAMYVVNGRFGAFGSFFLRFILGSRFGFAGVVRHFPCITVFIVLRDFEFLFWFCVMAFQRHRIRDDLGAFCVTHIASDSLDVVTDVDHVPSWRFGLSGSAFFFWYLVLCVAC